MLKAILATLARRRGRDAFRQVTRAASDAHVPVASGVGVAEAAPSAPWPRSSRPVSEDEIRLRAYLKWEAAGRPPGDGIAFWLEAKQELLPEK